MFRIVPLRPASPFYRQRNQGSEKFYNPKTSFWTNGESHLWPSCFPTHQPGFIFSIGSGKMHTPRPHLLKQIILRAALIFLIKIAFIPHISESSSPIIFSFYLQKRDSVDEDKLRGSPILFAWLSHFFLNLVNKENNMRSLLKIYIPKFLLETLDCKKETWEAAL